MVENADERVARVCRDLRPETLFPGRQESPCPLSARMTSSATPGVSIAVVDNFDVAWARGFGTREFGASDTVSPKTLFQAGSISKPVFALSVMKLIETGKLDLDGDVNDYLKSWQVPANDGWRPRITLRQLLSHTAGTTVHGFPGYPAAGPWPSLPQILGSLPPANNRPIAVDLIPGTQFRYSGGGTTIAQQVVLDVTGTPFPDLMRELVFRPLGMTDSSFEQPLPADLRSRAAMAHPWNGVQTQGGYRAYPEMAAAGLWTTATDLAALGAEVMKAVRGEASKLGLSPASIAEMLRPQLRDQKIGQDFVGLGWFCTGEEREFRFGHEGFNEGFTAEMRMFPALGQGAVVMINSIQGWFLRGELLGAIGREYQWPPSQSMPMLVAMPPGTGRDGSYISDDGASVRVTEEAERLLLQFDQQEPLPVFPATSGEFFATAVNLRAHFGDPAGAASASLVVVFGGKTITFRRASL